MTKKKFKFNITDIVIILVLLAAIAMLAYVFIFSDDTDTVKGESHNVRYVLELSSVNEMYKDVIKEGDKVTLSTNRGVALGYVTAPPEWSTHLITTFDQESEKEVYAERKGYVDIYVTFEASAIKQEWGYAIGVDETIMVVNNTYELLIGDMKCSATCIELDVLD